jgi:hypothetical protein
MGVTEWRNPKLGVLAHLLSVSVMEFHIAGANLYRKIISNPNVVRIENSIDINAMVLQMPMKLFKDVGVPVKGCCKVYGVAIFIVEAHYYTLRLALLSVIQKQLR